MGANRFFYPIVCLLAFLGCAQTQPAQRRDPPPGGEAEPGNTASRGGPSKATAIEIDSALPEGMQGVWLMYALGMAGAHADRAKNNLPPDLFADQVTGLQILVEIWGKMPNKPVPEPQLDTLLQVAAAGFLEEYALNFLAQPGWRVSADKVESLKLDEFAHWKSEHLAGHSFRPHAQVRWADVPAPPGGDLAARMPKLEPPTCGDALGRMQPLIAEWDSRRSSTTERLLSSFGREQFVQTLRWLKKEPPKDKASVLWMGEEVSTLYAAAAFCAIEARQPALAETYLRRALLYNPAHAIGYAELAHVLVLQRRLDEAMAETLAGMRQTSDPCVLAVLLRKRGYILVEKQQYQVARMVYQASLKLAPGNKVALTELKLIEAALRDAGSTASPASEDHDGLGAQLPTTVLTVCSAQ
jgi:tetratricopeptide (TPR) repeat protein